MIPLYTLLLSLATTHLVAAQDDRQKTAGHTFFLSHLSPIFTYDPSAPTDDAAAGWDVSLALHSTANTSASVEFAYFGGSFDVYGNYSMLDGIDRSNDNRWRQPIIKTSGSEGSFLKDIRSYTLQTNVPATTW
jgi:hypothetical protein